MDYGNSDYNNFVGRMGSFDEVYDLSNKSVDEKSIVTNFISDNDTFNVNNFNVERAELITKQLLSNFIVKF